MKIPSADIFHLIKSLSKNEKRYFKLMSNLQQGDKLHIKLFDEISKQKQYDEQKILFHLKLQQHKKWFSRLKIRLYDLILRSLENYHYTKYSGSVIRNLLNRHDILFERGLYNQCQLVINKAKSIAIKYESHQVLLEILEKEYQLNRLLTKKPALQKKNLHYSEKIFELGQQTFKYSNLFERLDITYNEYGVTRNPIEYKLMKSVFNNPLVKTIKEPETFVSKQKYFLIHTFKNYFERNFKQMHYYAKRRTDEYIDNPHFIEYVPAKYIGALNNVLISSLRTHNTTDLEYYFKKLNSLYATLSSEQYKKQAFISSLFGLKYYMEIKNYPKANAVIQKIINELPDYENKLELNDKMDFYANIFGGFFNMAHYHKAIHWLNKLRNFKAPEFEKVYFTNVLPLIYFITHYEAGADKDFLRSLFQSTYKKLSKKSLVFKLESILKDFFTEFILPDYVPGEKVHSAFLKLKKVVDKLSKDPVEKRFFLYFDFSYWVNLNIDKYSAKK